MPHSNRTVRGLKALRTLSGTHDPVIVPYCDYIVITTLERQKSLRESERANLLERLEEGTLLTRLEAVNSRLQFIKSKRAEILYRLGKHPSRQFIEHPMPKLRPAPVPSRAQVSFRTSF